MNVVVTGANGKIGSEIALNFQLEGHTVIKILKKEVDVSYYADVLNKCREIKKDFKSVDVLINCAGIKSEKTFEGSEVNDFQEIMSVNYLGSVFMIREILPLMNKGSHIINIGSMHGLVPEKNQIAYCSSKFALTGFTLSLRKDLEPKGIHVHLIVPSAVNTGDSIYSGKMLSLYQVVGMVSEAIKKNKAIVFPNFFKRLRYYFFVITGK